MRPYAIQSFRSDLGEVAACRILKSGGEGLRSVELSGPELTLTPEPETLYRCGELTALTVADPPAVGAWEIVFSSGSVPTVTTIPAAVLGLESFAAEAETAYEINVLDGRAVWRGWAVSAS